MWKPALFVSVEWRDLMLSLIPMTAAVFLMFSTPTLLTLFLVKPGSEWPLFYSLVLSAPLASYLSHLVPHYWLLLAGTGVMEMGVTAALLHRGSSTFFFIATGFGTAVVFHAAYISMLQCLKRQSWMIYSLMLLMFWLIIVNAAYMTDFVYSVKEGMLLVGSMVMLAWAVPAGFTIKHLFTSRTSSIQDTGLGYPWRKSSSSLNDNVGMASSNSHQQSRTVVGRQTTKHLLVWLLLLAWWALGVDISRMTVTVPNDAIRIMSLQGAFILTGLCVRIILAYRLKLQNGNIWSCNQFLVLNLIGMTGMSIVIYPHYTDPFPYHLLFSVAFFIQLSDIADLLINAQHTGSGVLSSPVELPVLQILMFRRGTAYVLCQSLVLFLSAVMFTRIIKPLAYSVFRMLMTPELPIAQDVACLGVLSLTTIIISFVVCPGGVDSKQGDLASAYPKS